MYVESNDAGGKNEKYAPWISFLLWEEYKKYFTEDMGNDINSINKNYHLKSFTHVILFNPLWNRY